MNGPLPIRAVYTLRKRRFRLLKTPSSTTQNGVYSWSTWRFEMKSQAKVDTAEHKSVEDGAKKQKLFVFLEI